MLTDLAPTWKMCFFVVCSMSSAVKSKKRARPSEGPSVAAEIELALGRKKALDTELLNLERQIYALETSYLENTAQLGDLIRGWGDFTNPSSPGGPGGSTMTKKKKKIMDHERIFSSSSVSALKNPDFHGLGSPMHSSSATPGAASRQHHSAAHGLMDEDEENDLMAPTHSAISLDMDTDTPSKPKSMKKANDTPIVKKARATAPKSGQKAPPKQPTAAPSLLGDNHDPLGSGPSFHSHPSASDDPFGQ